MEIKQLEYVLMAADMGSFNKASEYLYTTQSNVSKVVKSLEKELGYEIFRRQGGGVALTDAGKMLYEQSRQIMAMLQKIETYSDLAHKTCFHIASVASNFIAGRFAEFVAAHDGREYCMKMWEQSIRGVIELVEQGEAELGFFYIGKKQFDSLQVLLQKKGLVFQRLLPAQVEICVGKDHPLAGRETIAVEELKELEYVCLMEDNMSKMYHLHRLEKQFQLEKNMDNAIYVESKYALINLLSVSDRAHLCYGSVLDRGREGLLGIRPVPVDYGEEKVYLGYVSQVNRPVSPISQQFLDRLCEGYATKD